MNRLLDYINKRISTQSIGYLLLIFIIVYCVLLGIEVVIRGTSLAALRLLIILGIINGWLLGRTRFKLWICSLITVLDGLLITIIHVGGIDRTIWDLLKFSISSLWRWLFTNHEVDILQLNFLLSVLQTRISDVFFNLSQGASDFISGFYSYNQVSTLVVWGFFLWLLSSWISWITRRKDLPLWGVIPAGTALSIILTYTLQRWILLVILLGAGLILIGLINHEVKQREWKDQKVKGAEHVRNRLVAVVVGISFYTMTFAGVMPSVRIRATADPFERWIYGDNVSGEADSDSRLESGGINSDSYTGGRFTGLPRQKLIGSGPELAERVVMIVEYSADNLEKTSLPDSALYLRSFTYDRYTGRGWQTSVTEKVDYKPGQEITGIQNDNSFILVQDIRLSNALRGVLYSAGPPFWLDQEVTVYWRGITEESLFGERQQLVGDEYYGITTRDVLYQVRSLVPTRDIEELKLDQGDLPEWIESRYLQLPESIPTRVSDLAEEIISDQTTKYDQAKAIETFLRTYPYTLDLPEPPTDRDLVDYFLFDLKKGYCDYYATSMVVMARAVGLPARLAVGYVRGQYDAENNQYLISAADAHSWVEIYFDDHGWIAFEPTAAQNIIGETSFNLPIPPELEEPPQFQERELQLDLPRWDRVIGILGLLILVLFLGERLDWIRLKRLDPNSLILILSQRLFRYGRWLRIGHLRSNTLSEFEELISRFVRKMMNSPYRESRLITGLEEISQLIDFAIEANYAEDMIEDSSRGDILFIWKKLRGRLRYAIWISRKDDYLMRITNLGRSLRQKRILHGVEDG